MTAEDVTLAPESSETRLRWTFAFETHPAPVPPLLLARPLLDRVTGNWTSGVDRAVRKGVRA
ncbi:hypothetical protein HFP15_17670 [Amycolatopsis sp. K13G38]|uniref:SRPBCC family protein n=1 Tax=Amycolatopsis acididurans TaxID=2724524 RepID=A0ABX1J719_9PSEU|nr:hypothetical protein [Amycolatopsis acididurans]NKQ54714.1 hypothetical protein [Amycolatopsis acididurans]